jgi:hypothetical protein
MTRSSVAIWGGRRVFNIQLCPVRTPHSELHNKVPTHWKLDPESVDG